MPKQRWYVSTWIVLTLLIALAVLFNWPSRYVYNISFSEDQYGPNFYGLDDHLERGAPWMFMSQETYLQVTSPANGPAYLLYGEAAPSLWSLTDRVTDFNPLWLAADVAVWMGSISLLTIWYQHWRSNRHSIWQIGLRAFAAVIAIMGVAMGWLANEFRIHREERRVVQQLQELAEIHPDETEADPDYGTGIDRIPSGPAWLREILGGDWFSWRDRVFGVDVDSGELHLAAQLHSVQRLTLHWDIHPNQSPYLESMQSLRAVNARFASLNIDDELKKYPAAKYDNELTEKLERAGMAKLCQSFANLPKLEAINLNRSFCDDACLAHLGRLTNLRLLAIRETAVTDLGLRHLAKLTKLQVLDLGDLKITDAGLSSLSNLTELRELNLWGCTIQGRGLQNLKTLTKLKVLQLPNDIDRQAAKQLKSALPLVEMNGLD